MTESKQNVFQWFVEVFCKQWVWQKFCVNLVYKKFDKWKGWLYLSPALVLLAIFTIWPIFNTVRMSLLEGYTTMKAVNGQSFAFNGYLPVKPPERAKALKALERRAQQEHQSQIFIEAPYRNVKLMEQMLQVCGSETRLTVACDITSPEELISTRTIAQWRKCSMPDIAKRPTIFIVG